MKLILKYLSPNGGINPREHVESFIDELSKDPYYKTTLKFNLTLKELSLVFPLFQHTTDNYYYLVNPETGNVTPHKETTTYIGNAKSPETLVYEDGEEGLTTLNPEFNFLVFGGPQLLKGLSKKLISKTIHPSFSPVKKSTISYPMDWSGVVETWPSKYPELSLYKMANSRNLTNPGLKTDFKLVAGIALPTENKALLDHMNGRLKKLGIDVDKVLALRYDPKTDKVVGAGLYADRTNAVKNKRVYVGLPLGDNLWNGFYIPSQDISVVTPNMELKSHPRQLLIHEGIMHPTDLSILPLRTSSGETVSDLYERVANPNDLVSLDIIDRHYKYTDSKNPWEIRANTGEAVMLLAQKYAEEKGISVIEALEDVDGLSDYMFNKLNNNMKGVIDLLDDIRSGYASDYRKILEDLSIPYPVRMLYSNRIAEAFARNPSIMGAGLTYIANKDE